VQAFAPDLATKEHVIIVPTGKLWRIPFEALSTSPSEPRYLVGNYAISYTPSLVFLAKIIERANRQHHNTSQLSFVLADPQIAARPSVANDSGSVSSIFGNKAGFFQTRFFTGIDATRQCFLKEAPAAKLIVLATHAVAAGNNPVESLFALTPELGSDPKGALTAADIMSERLSANLAILSACETEKGRYVEGEGEIGCGWAFLYAGCASTLVSQWRVDRAATLKLTADFCRQLDLALANSEEQVSLATLLRSVQLAMLTEGEYGHPFYWAGIVLVGDPEWRWN
jgi:CHAT domain-containing protein